MRKYAEYKEMYPDKTDAQIIELLDWELGEKVEEIGRLLTEKLAYKNEQKEAIELLGECVSALEYLQPVHPSDEKYSVAEVAIKEIKQFLTNHTDGAED